MKYCGGDKKSNSLSYNFLVCASGDVGRDDDRRRWRTTDDAVVDNSSTSIFFFEVVPLFSSSDGGDDVGEPRPDQIS